MKTILIIFSVLAFAAVTVNAQGNAPAGGTNAPPPRSVFSLPTNPREGHDPFWPESTRIFDSAPSVTHSVEPTTLKINGYSMVNGRPIIIINNVSFLNGDEADLPAPGGGRTHLHCVDIQPDYVVVEVNGVRRDIRF
jgi:hypothetical protein